MRQIPDLDAADARCLVGGKQQEEENIGKVHAGVPCSVQCRWLLDGRMPHSKELGEQTVLPLVFSLCFRGQDCSTLWPCLKT